jgi:hypothetical protein
MNIIEEYFEEKKKAEAAGIKTNSIIGHGGWDWGKDTGWKKPVGPKIPMVYHIPDGE